MGLALNPSLNGSGRNKNSAGFPAWGSVAAMALGLGLALFLFLRSILEAMPSGIYHATGVLVAGGICAILGVQRFGLKYAVAAFVSLTPLMARLSEYYRPEVLGVTLTMDVIVIFYFFVATLIVLLRRGKVIRDSGLLLLAVFALYATLPIAVNGDAHNVGWTIWVCGILSPFLMYFIVVELFVSMADLELLLNSLVFVIFLSALFAMFQPLLSGQTADFLYLRLPSVYYNPVIFAGVIILLLPLAVFKMLSVKTAAGKLALALNVILIVIALMLTETRGGVVILILQVLWMLRSHGMSFRKLFRRLRGNKLVVIPVLIVLLVAAANFDMLSETVFRRFGHFDFSAPGNSAHERTLGWAAASEMGLEHFFGVGLGNFRYAYPSTRSATRGLLELESAHNFYLNIFAELGVLGLALFISILGLCYSRLRATAREFSVRSHERSLKIYLQASFVGYIIFTFTNYGEFLHKNVSLPEIYFFMICAIIACLSRMAGPSGTVDVR